MVEDVEELRPELQSEGLVDRKVLRESEIEDLERRTDHDIAPLIPVLPGICCGAESLETGGVEPGLHSVRSTVGIADDVRAVGTHPSQRDVEGLLNGKGRARLHGDDEVCRPALGEKAGEPGQIAPEGQLVD